MKLPKVPLSIAWVISSGILIFTSFIVFALVLIHLMGGYLYDNEDATLRKSHKEIVELFLSRNVQNINDNDIITRLSDNQILNLYDNQGQLITQYNLSNKEYDYEVNKNQLDEIIAVDQKDYSYISITSEINQSSHFGYKYAQIVHPIDDYNNIMKYMQIISIFIAFILIFLTLLVSYFITRTLTKSLRNISNQMEYIEKQGFKDKLTHMSFYTEIDQMTTTFNSMMRVLEENYKSQKQFVQDASHELRTPLTIIQGHIKLLNRWGKKDPKQLEESLEISLSESKRMEKLISSLLSLSKGQIGDELIRHNINLNDEIKRLVQSFKNVYPDYKFNIYSKMNNCNILFNKYQFEQVLLIFMDNAIKYDHINKNISLMITEKNEYIELQITDRGIGIPEEDLPYIFDRFYRVDKSRSKKIEGNGLGLAIAKKIVEQNKGQVLITSEYNKFTTVKVIFERV